jgi:COX assembly protein 2
MHPPLDRPHPECQQEILDLKYCHENRPLLKIWACNDIKLALDKCFKAEKAKLLKAINSDFAERRKREEEAWADAVGHKLSFDEYLKQDKTYQEELRKSMQRNPNEYQDKSTGGMTW